MTLVFTPHYDVKPLGKKTGSESGEIEIDEIVLFFNEETNMELNWLVGSTSGVHGGYTTLDEIEQGWEHTQNCKNPDCEDELHCDPYFTVLVIMPRICCLRYGNVHFKEKGEIDYVRQYITKSLKIMKQTQKGNLDKK